ncbi:MULTISPECIES: hypothetical protein [Polaribacter]|uniref:SprT-like domain-containing protein n=1 Tax=Polaribacter marinaquae TaxID=1642819 RepID=A0ABZ2TNY7_9FLAO
MYSYPNQETTNFSGEVTLNTLDGKLIKAFRFLDGVITNAYLPKEINYQYKNSLNDDAAECRIAYGCNHTSSDKDCICNNEFLNEIEIKSPPRRDSAAYISVSDLYGSGGPEDFSPYGCEVGCNGWDSGAGSSSTSDQIKNKLTNKCAKDIFTELENGIFENHPLKPEIQIPISNQLTLNFSESILKLFNDSSNINLTIQNGTTNGSNASTNGATITVNDNYLANATRLSIARTIIHESVHAYINALYSNVVSFNSFSFADKIEKYSEDKGYVIGTNNFHHNFMGQYIDAMAYSLYEWDKTYGTGGNLGWKYYQTMAYSGMFQVNSNGTIVTENDTFKELVPNANDRQAIADIILNEQNGNNDAQGTKCY